MSEVIAVGHDLPTEIVEQMRKDNPELFTVQAPTSAPATGPTHSLRMGGSIAELFTKCGLSAKDPAVQGHGVVFGNAQASCVHCASVETAELDLVKYKRGFVSSEHEGYYAWADGPDSGLSSKTIVQVLVGIDLLWPHWEPRTPLDAADFGRCSRMLALFPELRERLFLVSERHPEWWQLVEHWDELEELLANAPESLAARMRELEVP
jgi:hypothetical protein